MEQKKARSLPLVTIDRNSTKDPPKMQRGLALRRQRCKELQGLVVVLERKEEDHHGVLLSEIIKAGLLQYAQRLAPVPDGEELPFQDRWLKKSDPSARKLLTDLKRWASEPDPPEDKPVDSTSTVPDASTQDSNISQDDTAIVASDQRQNDSNTPFSDVPTPDAACDSKEPAVDVNSSQELVANEVLTQTKIDSGKPRLEFPISYPLNCSETTLIQTRRGHRQCRHSGCSRSIFHPRFHQQAWPW